MKRNLGHLGTVIGVCVLLGGCATVPPWERGNLAKPQMAFDQSPADSALRAHAYSSREAAASDIVGAGGGCGCY
jgi:hypothetical protein